MWDEEIVRACFSDEDADLILNIPLSLNWVHDLVSWPHTKSGSYIVKSAYFVTPQESFYRSASSNGKGSTSNQTSMTKEWKQLWEIKAPPKMKIVLWRLAHNCLLTGQQLKLR